MLKRSKNSKFSSFLIIGTLLSSSLHAAQDSSYQAKLNNYCEERTICTDKDKNIADEMAMVATCDDYYKSNSCDDVKATLGTQFNSSIISCDPKKFCESDNRGAIECTWDGIKAQLNLKSLSLMAAGTLGFMATGASGVTLATLPYTIYDTGKSAESCHKDLKFKFMAIKMHNLSIMEDEKPLKIDDENLMKMQCHDLTKFLTRREDALAERRNEKRSWSLDPKMSQQSPAAKAIIASMRSTRCMKPLAVKAAICNTLGAILVNGITGGLTTVAAKTTTKAFAKATTPEIVMPPDTIPYFEFDSFSPGGAKAIIQGIKSSDMDKLPIGTVLYDQHGKKKIVGIDKFDADGFYGFKKDDIFPTNLRERYDIPDSMTLDKEGFVVGVRHVNESIHFSDTYNINLITPEQMKTLPNGTVLFGKNGEKAIVNQGQLVITYTDKAKTKVSIPINEKLAHTNLNIASSLLKVPAWLLEQGKTVHERFSGFGFKMSYLITPPKHLQNNPIAPKAGQ